MADRSLKAGKFIVLEGIDGSGKSSLAATLSKVLLRLGFRNTLAHEPGSKIEHDIRAMFKSEERPGPDYMTVMFTSDRLLYMRDVINPALAQGLHVIADRHKLSTLVYQTASGATPELVRMLVDIPQPNPDLTIILDLPPEVARLRMKDRTLDSYERDIEKQTLMRASYLAHRNDFGPSVVLDASQDQPTILGDAVDVVLNLLEGRSPNE